MKAEPINESPVPNGILVIIGGKENKGQAPTSENQKENSEPLAVLRTFVEIIGRENATIAIVSTASSEGPGMFDDYKKAFNEIGGVKLEHIHHDVREDVLNDDSAELIKKVDAVFF